VQHVAARVKSFRTVSRIHAAALIPKSMGT
jgi:hypothetical protein